MIAPLVLLSLSLSIKSQINSCLTLESYKKNYKTDLSECHKLIASQDSEVKHEGKGSYGTVISCNIKTEADEPIKIAVKISRSPSPTTDLEEHRKMIDNELLTLDNINRLENTWLPLYYGCIYDATKDIVYIFMEHLDTTVKADLESNTYENFELGDFHVKVLQIMLQIARGIEGLHNIGMEHHDLHMGNIMLDTRSGVVKLIDFGHACIADEAKYEEAAECKNFKKGFNTDLKIHNSKPAFFCKLSGDVENFESVFMLTMQIVFSKPVFFRNSLMRSDNKQFKESIPSIFKSDGGESTIADIVVKLEKMLKERKDDELLNKDEFSENYRRENAEKFKLDLFQLNSESEGMRKHKVDSFEALKEKVIELEPRKNLSKTKKKKKATCGEKCIIFRRLLI